MSNFYKMAVQHDSKFLPICNQIFWRRVNDQFIDGYTIAVFMRLMFLPPGWNFKIKSMATMCGFSLEKTRKAVNNLKDLGYLTVIQPNDGKFGENIYVLLEAINMPIDPDLSTFPGVKEVENGNLLESISSPEPENPQTENPCTGNPLTGNPLTGYPSTDNPGPLINNNILINNNLLKNNKNVINNNTQSKDCDLLDLSKDQLDQKTCSHVSQNLNCFSKELNITKQNMPALDKNQEIQSIMAVTDPKNKPQEKKKRGGGVKNMVQKMEAEMGGSIRTVDTLVGHKMNELTEEDNNLSRAVSAANKLIALDKAVNKTNLLKLNNIKQMQKEADRLIPDMDVAKWFKDFLEVKIQKCGHMGKPTVGLLYDDLKAKACDNKQAMLVLLKEAIRLGWNDFYVTDNVQKQVESLKQVQQNVPVNDTQEEYEELIDENGNEITF